MRWTAPVAFAVLLPLAADARPIDYRCPPSYAGDGGRTLVLIARTTGVWRVDDPVPFVFGQGRFWRLVCSYRDPAAPADEMEAVAHWVDVPHEDGRLILEDVCADGEPPAGVVRSRGRQAKARAALPDSAPNRRLARELLAAVEAAAPPCPGTPGAAPVCARWEVVEVYAAEQRRLCTWAQGPDEAFRYLYRSECRFGGFFTSGTVKRIDEGLFERTIERVDGTTTRYLYSGDFESGGRVSGRFRWISSESQRGPEMDFQARCVEE